MKTLKSIWIFLLVLYTTSVIAKEKMVDFQNYQIHFKKAGKGEPKVIIEAGLGSGYDAYDTLLSAISEITTVGAYDRPGLGESSRSPSPRTLPVYVEELKKLLEKEKVNPPYILVGHSFGGLIIRYYANIYGDEVIGLIFIDPTPEGWVGYFKKTHSSEEIEKFNVALDPEKNQSTGVTKEEWKQIEYNCKLAEKIEVPMNIPIRLLSATKYFEGHQKIGYHPEDMTVWAEMQAGSYMNSNKNSKHIITDKSGHSIQLTEPELIINSIKELIEIDRSKNK